MSRGMQDRLRAALDAKAAAVNESTLSRAPILSDTPFATPPESFNADAEDDTNFTRFDTGIIDLHTARTSRSNRHARWFAPTLAAAAVAIVAVGAAAITSSVNADRRPVAPATEQSAPSDIPTTPSASSTTPAPTRSQGSPTPRTSVAPLLPKTLNTSIGGLTVPASWSIATGAPDGTTCLTVDGAVFSGTGVRNNCELWIRTIAGLTGDSTLAGGVVDPDRPGGTGTTDLCGSTTDLGIRTIETSDARIGDADAEHRVFSGSCITTRLQQWVVPTGPALVITRFDRPEGTDVAALQALQSARLSGSRTAMRLVDRGYIRSTTAQPSKPWLLMLDRAYLNADGTISNQNPAEYEYPEAPMEAPSGLISIRYYHDKQWTDISEVGLSYLLQHTGFSDTLPPIESMVADITTDGNYVTSIVLHVPGG